MSNTKQIYQIAQSDQRISLLLCVFIVLLFPSRQLSAQIYPVDANVVLVPPHSLTLSDYSLERSQDFMIQLTLNDPVEAFRDVRLVLTIENEGTEILQTAPFFIPTSAVQLSQYATLTLTGFELAEYLDFNNLITLNGYRHNGQLPEGLNGFCIQVFDAIRPEVAISAKTCAYAYATRHTPPLLQFPQCGEEISMAGAQNLMFTWLPTHLAAPGDISSIEYEFTLVRVEEGYNPYDAVEAAMPVYQTITSNTSLILQEPLLEQGYQYAWRVRAVNRMDGLEENAFENQGYSEVCFFRLSAYDLPVSPKACDAPCTINLPSNAILLYDLKPGDQVAVGNFSLAITKVDTVGDGFF